MLVIFLDSGISYQLVERAIEGQLQLPLYNVCVALGAQDSNSSCGSGNNLLLSWENHLTSADHYFLSIYTQFSQFARECEVGLDSCKILVKC